MTEQSPSTENDDTEAATLPSVSSKPVKKRPPGFARRIAGAFAVLVAASIAGILTLAGTTIIHERSAARPKVKPLPALQVETIRATYADHFVTAEHYAGRFEAARSSRLAFERPGTVIEVLVDEGDRVKRGDVIARLDIQLLEARNAELEARRDTLEAQAELARLTKDRKEALIDRGFATGEDVDTARLALVGLNSSLREVDAGLKAVAIDKTKSVLRAPYDGTIGERRLDEGAIVAAGTAVVDVVETGRPQIRVGIPQRHLGSLEIGKTYEIDHSGRLLDAALTSIRPDIDPTTRTVIAVFDIKTEAELPLGANADLVLNVRRDAAGFWVPMASLRAGARGLWTVLTVVDAETGGRIGLESVEILALDGDEAFVRGSVRPDARIVADGTHRIVPGMPVQPVELANR
ncbi:MAG: efflux RND transporter periplasmic adaptor subunit [Pseudomonadota bacterium]